MTQRVVITVSAVGVSVLATVSAIGLLHGGFVERFEPNVVQLDKARAPKIPFVKCDGMPVAQACSLGRADGIAKVLLWGDSHLMALAPALDDSLEKLDLRAVFVSHSGCPPMLDVYSSEGKPRCPLHNIEVKNYLLNNPDIKTVLLASYWSYYFREDGPLAMLAGSPPAKGTDAAIQALSSTIRFLRDAGKHVVLVGPVPVYRRVSLSYWHWKKPRGEDIYIRLVKNNDECIFRFLRLSKARNLTF